MGLYLCIFDDDEQDVEGVEVGSYADFNSLRDHVTRELENGKAGSKFPVLIQHSDCDGEWSPSECEKLLDELEQISNALKARPPISWNSDWQKAVANSIGLVPSNAFESYIDVDGEFLLDRLQHLARTAIKRNLPISFQ